MLIDYYVSCWENSLQLLANGLIVLYIFSARFYWSFLPAQNTLVDNNGPLTNGVGIH